MRASLWELYQESKTCRGLLWLVKERKKAEKAREKVIDMQRYAFIDVVIPSGSTTSGLVPLKVPRKELLYSLKGVVFPSAMTGTTLTYRVAADPQDTPVLLTDASTTISANTAVSLDAAIFAGWFYMEFVSNLAEAADRTLKVLVYDI